MATDGCQNNTSDECFDLFCTPCSKIDKKNEAEKFCVECQEYLCTTCVKDHNKFSALAQHHLLERSQFGTTSETDSSELPSEPTERCKIHPMKLVDMYCQEHDFVGCHVCFTITHRQCQDIHYIPEYVHKPHIANHLRQTKNEMKTIISNMKQLEQEKRNAIEYNNKNRNAALEEIKIHRAHLDKLLNCMEQTAVAEVDEEYNKLEQRFKEELKHVQDTLVRLTEYMMELEDSKKNVSQDFVNSKVCEKLISEMGRYKTETKETGERMLAFIRNSKILTSLEKFTSLGHLQIPQKHNLYEPRGKFRYSVKQRDDSEDCDIWSSCLLDNGDILLSDCTNKKIKLVESKTYTVRESMLMPANPCSVCKVSATEAAVSLYNNTVEFVSIRDQLIRKRSLKFGHSCRGISVIGSNLVLCEFDSKVHVYKMNGERLRSVVKDESGNPIFKDIREISVSVDGKMIHIAGDNEFLKTIDKEGKVIWRCSSPALNDTWGVCTDGSGNVFVSGQKSQNVVQIGSDGQYVGEVIPASYGLKYPKAVCFDRKNSKLNVSSGNEIYVFLVEEVTVY